MPPSSTPPAVRLLVASRGNDVMTEIARLLAQGFAQLNVPCDLAVDQQPVPPSEELVQLVVAPHEYFPLFVAPRMSAKEEVGAARQVHVLNVEQPGSEWFELAFRYARLSRGVFDISLDGAAELRRRGLDAVHTPLGFVPISGNPAPSADVNRPIDVVFLGHHSSRREQFFARHAGVFSAMDTRLVLTDPRSPRLGETPGYFAGVGRQRLLNATKILLNVHSSERPYFESHRALLAMTHGCLLVTEDSRHTRPFAAGRHFVAGHLDELPSLCVQYLSDAVSRTAIAEAGRLFLRTDLAMANTCRTVLAACSTPNRGTGQSDATQRAAVRARLATALATRAASQPDWVASPNAAYNSATPPAVTVAVTVHNYARVVGECVASVLGTTGIRGGIELVVIDDASDDHSADVVDRLIQPASVPALLLRKKTNTGLADARNLAFEQARGNHVFVLDADNWVYPLGLRRLHDAIVEGRYVAAYGLIRRFDDDTDEALGLLSYYAWNVRELVRGPYIDAMALFDRNAVLKLGGYSTDLVDHGWFGWEDYDLWLRIAESGGQCTLVPSIVGAYRVHADSMISRTNQYHDALARYFQRRFARLAGEFPGLDQYFGLPPTAVPAEDRLVVGGAGPNDALARRCGDLELELREVYRSKSWRITSPLRFVFRMLTGRPN
jgi:GT2 family glycosyltransferase